MRTVLVLAGVLLAALPARALDTCNGLISVDFVPPTPSPVHEGDTVRLHVDLGTGSINGGSLLTINTVHYDMSCQPPLVPNCTPAVPLGLAFTDAIMSDCPGSFTASPSANETTFTPGATLQIAADQITPPGFCSLEFNVLVLPGTAGTTIDGLLSFGANGSGATCNNGLLVAGGFQTISIAVATTTTTTTTTSTTTTTTTSTTTTTTLALHFGCYEIPRGNIPVESLTLAYRFGSVTAKTARLHQLCAPTNKNDEDPSAVTNPVHMSLAPLKAVAGTFSQPAGTQIVTQFGTYTADVKKPVTLMLPTSKSLTPPPPPPLVTTEPHRVCMKLVHETGPTASPHVVDQFTAATGGITPTVTPRRLSFLCLPVNKNGEDQSAPSNPAALMCFLTTNDKLPFGQRSVFITNQFGGFPETITRYDFLCVPATVP